MFSSYDDLLKNYKHIVLPIGWNSVCEDGSIVFYFVRPNGYNKMAVVEKQLVFTDDEKVECYVLNCPVQLDDFEMTNICFPFSSKLIEETLCGLNVTQTCNGGPSPDNFKGTKKLNFVYYYLNYLIELCKYNKIFFYNT